MINFFGCLTPRTVVHHYARSWGRFRKIPPGFGGLRHTKKIVMKPDFRHGISLLRNRHSSEQLEFLEIRPVVLWYCHCSHYSMRAMRSSGSRASKCVHGSAPRFRPDWTVQEVQYVIFGFRLCPKKRLQRSTRSIHVEHPTIICVQSDTIIWTNSSVPLSGPQRAITTVRITIQKCFFLIGESRILFSFPW